MRILVTGAAGFIGSATCEALVNAGYKVFGIDSISDFYSQDLKWLRVKNFLEPNNVNFELLDLADHENVKELIDRVMPEAVVHLAAQAGVRTPL